MNEDATHRVWIDGSQINFKCQRKDFEERVVKSVCWQEIDEDHDFWGFEARAYDFPFNRYESPFYIDGECRQKYKQYICYKVADGSVYGLYRTRIIEEQRIIDNCFPF